MYDRGEVVGCGHPHFGVGLEKDRFNDCSDPQRTCSGHVVHLLSVVSCVARTAYGSCHVVHARCVIPYVWELCLLPDIFDPKPSAALRKDHTHTECVLPRVTADASAFLRAQRDATFVSVGRVVHRTHCITLACYLLPTVPRCRALGCQDAKWSSALWRPLKLPSPDARVFTTADASGLSSRDV